MYVRGPRWGVIRAYSARGREKEMSGKQRNGTASILFHFSPCTTPQRVACTLVKLTTADWS